MMKKVINILFVICSIQTAFAAVPKKIIQETIEAAAKVSGKSVGLISRKSAAAVLQKMVLKYGDDALKVVEHGGLEAFNVGKKYGDDFWKLSRTAKPAAIRSLVLHADDLMPAARRLGKDFMTLEGKVPGLGRKIVSEFGDDAAIVLAKNASPDDISKIVGYAAHADSPATKRMLLEAYKKGGSKFLKNLNWKHIVATGLSAAAIVSAYKVSNGIEEGIVDIAQNDPETFERVTDNITSPIYAALWIAVVILLVPLAAVMWKITEFINRCGNKNRSMPETKASEKHQMSDQALTAVSPETITEKQERS